MTLLKIEKPAEHVCDSDINCTRYNHQRIGKRTRGLGNKWRSENHTKYSIVEIGQNTEESPEDVR